MGSWGKIWTIRYKKTKKPTCHFWRAESKGECQEQKQGTVHVRCAQHHPRGEKTTQAAPPAQPQAFPFSHPFQGTNLPPTPPYPTPATGASEQESTPTPAAAGIQIKPCLNFLSGPRSTSTWLIKEAKNTGL